ncbi:MAG: TonB-dependent receptor plug domain-containing protein, partial [Halieaceae bacterium]|nr:TonB-dependent receptor plug domain-containing protein [Halieaceae bacterium]
MRKTILALNIGALGALGAPTLQAQESSGFALEEVVVTAQKREENLQDIPVSAQAFNAEDMRVLGTDTLSELIFAAPSLNAGGLGGSQQVMGLRGIIDFSRNPGVDPRMGIYIDEV